MVKMASWFKSATASVYWYSTVGRWRLKDAFNDLYEGQTRSPTFRGIFRDAFGDQFAEEVDPCGFLTLDDLQSLLRYLHIGQDQAFVDLACGRGGTGLWIARATGARLVGVDLAEVAIDKARRRIADFGLEGRAEFRVGDFAATGLPAASFDGAISIDSLFLVADKTGSVEETARILKPGARFVVTTWEMDLPGGVKDYRPMLEAAGFEVEAYEKTPQWEQRQRAIHEGVLGKQDALVKEMGKPGATVWFRFAKEELPKLSHMQRVLIAARKK
jgi:SAM-dependent methyltransferase